MIEYELFTEEVKEIIINEMKEKGGVAHLTVLPDGIACNIMNLNELTQPNETEKFFLDWAIDKYGAIYCDPKAANRKNCIFCR